MGILSKNLRVAIVMSATTAGLAGQTPSTLPLSEQIQQTAPASVSAEISPALESTASIQHLLDFNSSDVKFDLRGLMDVLRDRRHEGWVLAAYPDPKTHRPLIGAGFSLDLPAREHLQRDPLNPRSFLEPSSADLWQAAGLDPAQLQLILKEFHARFPARTGRRSRVKFNALTRQITDVQAELLLRIGAIQAIYNAKAYCRNFDQLGASQQMALSQLVYQMGVNLEEFTAFLSLINSDSMNDGPTATLDLLSPVKADSNFWELVQKSLIQSQWARLYRTRAISVIAMLDPQYPDDPRMAEQRVGAALRPAVVHRHKSRAFNPKQFASASGDRTRRTSKGTERSRTKRRA